MAKRSGVGWLLAGVTLLFGGVAFAATSSKAGPSPSGDKNGDQTGTGKQGDKDKSESPGSDDNTPHAKGFRRALLAFAQKTKAAADEAARLGQDQKESGQVAAAATSTVGAVLAAIPTIGQILALAAQLFALMFKQAGYGAFIPRTDTGLFTGWKEDCYFFREVPIYGPAIEQLKDKIEPIAIRGDNRQLDAFVTLCQAFPQGPPVAVVSVSDVGDYEYRFNVTKPGDLSEEAKAAEQIRWMQVYSPADITPRGPRGFDPANPWGWKVPGERASAYDRAVKADPSNAAAGM